MLAAEIIAGVLGPVYVVIAVGMLVDPDRFRQVMREFLDNSAVTFVGGLVALVVGLLILAFHHSWSADWRVVVTIIGWLAVAKGMTLIVFPALLLRLSRAVLESVAVLRVGVVVALALGAFLSYAAYFRV